MKITISSIAWNPSEEAQIAGHLVALGIKGVEIAPTKIWSSLDKVTQAEAKRYRDFWESQGIRIVAIQSLLYGRPDLLLFGGQDQRRAMQTYLSRVIELAANLGAGVLVFGAPGNRRRGNLPASAALEIAVPFFRSLGETAKGLGTAFCIEPNPSYYQCDFVTTVSEGIDLVKAVNHPGFGLHADAAAMTLSGETCERDLPPAVKSMCHFHVSEPNLAAIPAGDIDHSRFAAILKQHGYAGWVSLEMRSETADNARRVQQALDFAIKTYG